LVDIAEKVREARLRWYGHVIRRDEGELVRDIWNEEIRRRSVLVDIAEKLRWYGHVISGDEGELVRDMEWKVQKVRGCAFAEKMTEAR
jgi:hypothetical protein